MPFWENEMSSDPKRPPESAVPALADFLDQQRMCPTGLDPPRANVVPGGAQIAVSEQIAGNADLIRPGDGPGRCRRITSIVRSDTDAKPSESVAGGDQPNRGISQSAAAWADPQRVACRAPEHSRTNDRKIGLEIRVQEFGDCKLNSTRSFLHLRARHNKEPGIAFPD